MYALNNISKRSLNSFLNISRITYLYMTEATPQISAIAESPFKLALISSNRFAWTYLLL